MIPQQIFVVILDIGGDCSCCSSDVPSSTSRMHPPVTILLEAAIKLLAYLGSLPKSRSRSWHNHSSLRV